MSNTFQVSIEVIYTV